MPFYTQFSKTNQREAGVDARRIFSIMTMALLCATLIGGPLPALSEGGEALYTICRVEGVVDWEQIPTFAIDHVQWMDDFGIRAGGQLCYDDENLYVRLFAVEDEIRAEYTAPLSPVFQDSCLEFFFGSDDYENYFNFEINPNGCLHIQTGPARGNRVSLVKGNDAEYFDIRAQRTEDGWEVAYRIPLEFLRVFWPDFAFTGDLRANAYKCGNMTVHKHYLTWNPVQSEKPDFHRPEDFGRMTFDSGL